MILRDAMARRRGVDFIGFCEKEFSESRKHVDRLLRSCTASLRGRLAVKMLSIDSKGICPANTARQ